MLPPQRKESSKIIQPPLHPKWRFHEPKHVFGPLSALHKAFSYRLATLSEAKPRRLVAIHHFGLHSYDYLC
jgi:hypothetical protein